MQPTPPVLTEAVTSSIVDWTPLHYAHDGRDDSVRRFGSHHGDVRRRHGPPFIAPGIPDVRQHAGDLFVLQMAHGRHHAVIELAIHLEGTAGAVEDYLNGP